MCSLVLIFLHQNTNSIPVVYEENVDKMNVKMMQWGLQLERLLDNPGYQLQIDETESQDHELKGPWRDW